MSNKKSNKLIRKPGHHLDRLVSNEQLKKNESHGNEVGEFLLKNKNNTLVKKTVKPLEFFSVSQTAKSHSLPTSFSLKSLGDYIFNIVDTNIVGAAHGCIDDIPLTVPPKLDKYKTIITDSQIWQMDERHIKHLISLMDAHTNFTILCHTHQVSSVEQWFKNLNIDSSRVDICISVFKYSIWAQDAYVASNGSILCEGVKFVRNDDMSIADDVSAQTEISALQFYLYILILMTILKRLKSFYPYISK